MPRTEKFRRAMLSGMRPAGVLGVAALCALFLRPAEAAERIWLDLQAPREREIVRAPLGLVEVRGWAGTGVRGGHDVLIAIDRSLSVWQPSGADIDGDGRVGELRRMERRPEEHAHWTTDAGDTIFQAELAAARRLIERLDPQTTRMGIVAFGGRVKVLAPLGSSDRELLEALDQLPAFADWTGTHFYHAFKRSIEVFEAAGGSEQRHRALILLSDGSPTVPQPTSHAEAFAVVGARRAAEIGVRVYAFAVGPSAVSNPELYREITRVTGGELVLVDQPVDVIDYVPHLSLTRLTQVTIDNLSSSEKARAVRLFPDGTFDGYAPLVPGDNLLRITLHAEGGSWRHVDRRVVFEPTLAETEAQRSALRQLLKDLRVRTLETELAARVRRKRQEQLDRRIEIRVEEAH